MAEISTRAVRALTDTHTDIHTVDIHTDRQTDYCNPAAHAQRVKNLNNGSKHYCVNAIMVILPMRSNYR